MTTPTSTDRRSDRPASRADTAAVARIRALLASQPVWATHVRIDVLARLLGGGR